MINLFAAKSHFQCAKSAHLYSQLMDELPVDYPPGYIIYFSKATTQSEDLTDFGQDFGQI